MLFLCLVVNATGVVAVAAQTAPQNQDAEQDQAAEQEQRGNDCINLPQVRRTRILDDHTILFYMSGQRIKKASLAFGCPSLKFYGSFSYRSYNNRLCARFDTIVSRSGAHCPISEIEDYTPPDQESGKEAKP